MNTHFCITKEYSQPFNEDEIIKYFSSFDSTAILESSMYSKEFGRYSIIGIEPFLFFSSKGNNITFTKGDSKEHITGNPLEQLRGLLKKYKVNKLDEKIPFRGGCMGYLSYDLVNFIEEIEQKNCDDLKAYDIALGFYNKAIIIDHFLNKLFIACTSVETEEVNENIEKIEKMIAGAKDYKIAPKSFEKNKVSSNFNKQEYINIVEKAREYIRNGDIFQVNLSQRFEININATPQDIYLRLRECSPAPFSAFLNFDGAKVISSSPERFLKINGRSIETRPIKGTRPRGTDSITDTAMKNELLNSEKEQSELTMIVDLQRNDLGRICEFGSVNVKSHFEIEQYANVFHAVSTITGRLKSDIDVVDCLKSTFPGGSITGAPKIRAMEIIEELERAKRGIYTGAIGYIGFDGDIDLSIAIRTIVVKDNKAYYNVGGGIVWDSTAEKEYDETLHKGTKMLEVLTGGNSMQTLDVLYSDSDISSADMGFLYGFSLFETFLVGENGKAFLLEKHIGRLMNSAHYFGIDVETDFKDIVKEYIAGQNISNKIVRITLTAGNKQKNINASLVFTSRENSYTLDKKANGCRLHLSQVRKSESSITIRHKTGNYVENYFLLQKAIKNGFDDALFLNSKGEITETTKANIFFVKGDTLFTPDIGCGLLPGIIRQWIIENSQKCVKGNFYLEDLLNADEVFVCNSAMHIIHVSSIDKKVFSYGKITKLLQKELNLECN